MKIRDAEIQRLINYASGLGVAIIYDLHPNKSADADWDLSGTKITIYTHNMNKTDIILALIHEIGHAKWYITKHHRQLDAKFAAAIDEEYSNKPTTQKARKKILEVETDSTEFWHVIYTDVGLKIPVWKVNRAMEFDIWQYQVYYETGRFPNTKTKIEMLKSLKLKHKPK